MKTLQLIGLSIRIKGISSGKKCFLIIDNWRSVPRSLSCFSSHNITSLNIQYFYTFYWAKQPREIWGHTKKLMTGNVECLVTESHWTWYDDFPKARVINCDLLLKWVIRHPLWWSCRFVVTLNNLYSHSVHLRSHSQIKLN